MPPKVHRKVLKLHLEAADWPAGLCLPVVVQHLLRASIVLILSENRPRNIDGYDDGYVQWSRYVDTQRR